MLTQFFPSTVWPKCLFSFGSKTFVKSIPILNNPVSFSFGFIMNVFAGKWRQQTSKSFCLHLSLSDWLFLHRLTFKMYAYMLYVHTNRQTYIPETQEWKCCLNTAGLENHHILGLASKPKVTNSFRFKWGFLIQHAWLFLGLVFLGSLWFKLLEIPRCYGELWGPPREKIYELKQHHVQGSTIA